MPVDPDAFDFRWMTARGDLRIGWKKDRIHFDGLLATSVEADAVRKWAAEWGLKVEGDLLGQAHVVAPPKVLKKAIEDLVDRQVKDPGYLLYAVDKKGKAKVVESPGTVDATKTKQVVKAARTRGG
jgi:hypothetical protein